MIAIYVRQSIEKLDSLSLDLQAQTGIDICTKNNWEYEIYKDSGYSGSNTDRPAYKKLMQDIKLNKINKVIVYRLDRISRSVVDFVNLLQFFEKYNVDFLSSTENIDNSTAIGRVITNILMSFAQFERETIATRIKDNYFTRAKRGTFVGGGIPYGYTTKKTVIEGKETSILVLENANMINKIYEDYVINSKSLREIGQQNNMTSRKIRIILTNTFYVKADMNIYNYLKSKGYIIYNNIEDFNSTKGIQIFGKEKGKKNRIKTDITTQIVVIGRHEAVIDSNIFILAQQKLEKNKQNTNKRVFGQYSWLTGILICGACGHSVGIKATRGYMYSICSKHRLYNACSNKNYYITKDVEDVVIKKIKKHLLKLDFSKTKKQQTDNNVKMEIAKIDEQIENIVNSITSGTVLSKILEDKAEKLLKEKQVLEDKLYIIEEITPDKKAIDKLINNFDNLSIPDKRSLIKTFVDKIIIKNNDIQIFYLV